MMIMLMLMIMVPVMMRRSIRHQKNGDKNLMMMVHVLVLLVEEILSTTGAIATVTGRGPDRNRNQNRDDMIVHKHKHKRTAKVVLVLRASTVYEILSLRMENGEWRSSNEEVMEKQWRMESPQSNGEWHACMEKRILDIPYTHDFVCYPLLASRVLHVRVRKCSS